MAPSNNSHVLRLGYGIAIMHQGVILADPRNNGPDGNTQDSGAVWFFR